MALTSYEPLLNIELHFLGVIEFFLQKFNNNVFFLNIALAFRVFRVYY